MQILSALHDFGHYNETVFDDIADSITYCNSYLAPIKAPTSEVGQWSRKQREGIVCVSRGH
jgi:protein phosphatase 1 regulatory subunit 42